MREELAVGWRRPGLWTWETRRRWEVAVPASPIIVPTTILVASASAPVASSRILEAPSMVQVPAAVAIEAATSPTSTTEATTILISAYCGFFVLIKCLGWKLDAFKEN